MKENCPKSTAAFLDLLITLRAANDEYLDPARGVDTDMDRLEGFRYLLHLVSAGVDLYLEGDAERPYFTRMVSPTRKFGGDNPDALYHFALIRGDRSYRITGRMDRACYMSFTVHGRIDEKKLGMAAEPVLADVNDRALKIAADGSFELILSPRERTGNWLKLEPDAASVIARHFFELDEPAASNTDIDVKLSIEALEPAPLRPAGSDESMARRIADVTAFVRGSSIELLDLGSLPLPFVSRIPNKLPQPSSFRTSGSASWGAVDIAYAMAPFRVGPDEALVMEGAIPECAFANVMLWNRHMQTLEFRDRRVSLNRKQMRLGSDGSYRIVIAHRNPGVPNWLDTEGHNEGTIFWRFLLPKTQPAAPECTLVPLAK